MVIDFVPRNNFVNIINGEMGLAATSKKHSITWTDQIKHFNPFELRQCYCLEYLAIPSAYSASYTF